MATKQVSDSGESREKQAEKFAGLEELEEAQGTKRKIKVESIPRLGTVRLQSLSADEYAPVETLVTQAGLMLRNKKPQLYQQLNAEAFFQLALLMWVDEGGTPVLTDNERCRRLLAKLDSVASEALQNACLKWAGIGDAELEAAAKK